MRSLHTLRFWNIEDHGYEALQHLHRLLSALNPLRCLQLDGCIDGEAMDIVFRRHGATLRNLSAVAIQPCSYPLVVFSKDTVQRLAASCPNLKQIWLAIHRTRGDDEEVGIYHALASLRRLRYARLNLLYIVGPNPETWDQERDGEYPFEEGGGFDAGAVHFMYLREAFSNSAIDAALARSIFNIISSGSSLRYLVVQPERKLGPYNRRSGISLKFQPLMGWLNRSWCCTKARAGGEVSVRELGKEDAAVAGEAWKELSEKTEFEYGENLFMDVFRGLWPPRRAEWWSDWESLPLWRDADGERIE